MVRVLFGALIVCAVSLVVVGFVHAHVQDIPPAVLGCSYATPLLAAIVIAGFLGFYQNHVAVYGCAAAGYAAQWPELIGTIRTFIAG